MRAFRVIRLFGRVKELKTMITAVTASIVPMMHAFVILLIVLGICERCPPPLPAPGPPTPRRSGRSVTSPRPKPLLPAESRQAVRVLTRSTVPPPHPPPARSNTGAAALPPRLQVRGPRSPPLSFPPPRIRTVPQP